MSLLVTGGRAWLGSGLVQEGREQTRIEIVEKGGVGLIFDDFPTQPTDASSSKDPGSSTEDLIRIFQKEQEVREGQEDQVPEVSATSPLSLWSSLARCWPSRAGEEGRGGSAEEERDWRSC